MKILFSNMPWWENDAKGLRIGVRAGSRWPFTRHSVHAPDKFAFGGYLPFPFFLGYAASYTAREFPEAKVTMRDSIARGESYETYLRDVHADAPDWIVIETATPSWNHDEMVIRQLARLAPGAKIIIAGTIDCKRSAEIFTAYPNVVAIVQGEYDKQIAKVIRGARGLVAHDLLTEAEMNAAPLPMWDDECALHYADGCPKGQQFPQLQIWTSRGCPFKCVFCVWPAVMTGNDPDGTRPRKVRGYSPEYVERLVRERMEWAAKRGAPYRCVYLDDDTFNLTNAHALAISGAMKRIGLPWSAMCRADTVTRETWRVMRDAGCFGPKLGFESGVQRVVDEIVNKRLELVKALETAKWLRSELGMTVHGTFTIGLPGETSVEADATRAFIRDAYAMGAIDTHQLSGTAEIEGTPMHTLRTGDLAKYPGAHLDANAPTLADGQRKIEEMVDATR